MFQLVDMFDISENEVQALRIQNVSSHANKGRVLQYNVMCYSMCNKYHKVPKMKEVLDLWKLLKELLLRILNMGKYMMFQCLLYSCYMW